MVNPPTWPFYALGALAVCLARIIAEGLPAHPLFRFDDEEPSPLTPAQETELHAGMMAAYGAEARCVTLPEAWCEHETGQPCPHGERCTYPSCTCNA